MNWTSMIMVPESCAFFTWIRDPWLNNLDPPHCTSALKTGSGSADERAADPQHCTRTNTLISTVCRLCFSTWWGPGSGERVGKEGGGERSVGLPRHRRNRTTVSRPQRTSTHWAFNIRRDSWRVLFPPPPPSPPPPVTYKYRLCKGIAASTPAS